LLNTLAAITTKKAGFRCLSDAWPNFRTFAVQAAGKAQKCWLSQLPIRIVVLNLRRLSRVLWRNQLI
jgi:hypothetical protein